METRETVGHERAGLVSLGLIMQLVGSIVAAYLVVRALDPGLRWLLGQGWTIHFGYFYDFWNYHDHNGRGGLPSPAWHLTLLASVGIVRAVLHRRAGGAILYRKRGGAGALYAYVAVALLHTGLCLAIFLHDLTGPTYQWSVAALLGTAWPICLLIAATRRSFRGALRAGPAAKDGTAPDEVATLAIFMGLVGAMVAVFVVYAAAENQQFWDSTQIPSRALTVVGVLLLVRALVQVRSGLRVAGRSTDDPVPIATARYIRAALVGSALIVVALVVHLHRAVVFMPPWDVRLESLVPRFLSAVPAHVLAAYLVVLWPALLLRFVAARKSATSTGDASRRPRASLAALGWFLLAAGALQIAFALLGLIAGAEGMHIAWNWAHFSEYLVSPADPPPRSGWLALLVAIPQIWTALEILGGTGRRKASATAFAACGSLAIILSNWGDLHYLSRLIGVGLPHPSVLITHLHFAFPLVVPIATLVFVQHHLREESARPTER